MEMWSIQSSVGTTATSAPTVGSRKVRPGEMKPTKAPPTNQMAAEMTRAASPSGS